MVFNAVKDIRPFMYNYSKLDKVDSFKYLGMTINRRANLQYSQQIDIQQALKAKALLECYLNNHNSPAVSHICPNPKLSDKDFFSADYQCIGSL